MRGRENSRRSHSSHSPHRGGGGRRHDSPGPGQSRRGEAPDPTTPQTQNLQQQRAIDQPGVGGDRERWEGERERERGGSRGGGRHYRDRSNSPSGRGGGGGSNRSGGRGRRYSVDSSRSERHHSRGRDHRGREYDSRDRDNHRNQRDYRDGSRDGNRDGRERRGGFRDRMDEGRRDEWNDDADRRRHASFDDRNSSRSDINNPDSTRFESEGGVALATSLVPSPHTDPSVEPLLSFDKWARSGGAIQPLGPGTDPMMPIEVRYERYVDQWEERRNEFFVRDHEDEDWFKEKYMLESLLALKDEHAKRVHSEAEGFATKISVLPWLEATKRNVDVVGKQNSSQSRKRRDRDRDGEEARPDFDVIGDEYESEHIVYIARVPASVSRQLLETSLKEAISATSKNEDGNDGTGDVAGKKASALDSESDEEGDIELHLSETIQHFRNDKHIRSAWALCPTAAMAKRLIKQGNLTVTIPGEEEEDEDDEEEGDEGKEEAKDGDANRAKRARVSDNDDSADLSKSTTDASAENDNKESVSKNADADDNDEAARAEKRAARRRRARRGSESKGQRTVLLSLDVRRRLPNRMCPQEASHPARVIRDLRMATQLANQLDEIHELHVEHRLAAVFADDSFAAINDPVIALARTLASSSKDGSVATKDGGVAVEGEDAKEEAEKDHAATDPLVVYLTDCKKLDITLSWLRRVHLVCYYSGTRFSSPGAMLQACSVPFVRFPLVPGVTSVSKPSLEVKEGTISKEEEEEENAESDSSEKGTKHRKTTTAAAAAAAATSTTQVTVANKSEMKRLKSLLMNPRELQRKSQQSDGGRGGDRDKDRRSSSWLARWFETLDRGIERMVEESSESTSTWVKDQQAADEAKLAKLKADAVAAFCKENTKAEDANYRCLLPPYKLFRTQEFVESYIRRKHKDRLALVESLASKAMASEICKREARQRRVDEHNRARRGVEQAESSRRGNAGGHANNGGGGGGRRGGEPPMFQHQQQPPPFHGHQQQHHPMPHHQNHNHQGHPRPPFHPHAQQSPMGPRGGPGGGPGVAFRHPAVAGPGPGPGGPGPPRGANAWAGGRRYRDYDAPAPEEKKPVEIQYRSKVDYSDL